MKTKSQLKKTGQIKLEDRRIFKDTKPKKAKENLKQISYRTCSIFFKIRSQTETKSNSAKQNQLQLRKSSLLHLNPHIRLA
jgi:hypothetical protein